MEKLKLKELKSKVYYLTSTQDTKHLKRSQPQLTVGKDLRRKDSWLAIYQFLLVAQNLLTPESQPVESFSDVLDVIKQWGDDAVNLKKQIDRTYYEFCT